jgi:hypothetical protein
MTLREREDRIFDKYRCRAMGEPFIPDGAISETYVATCTRLLVILKEPNDSTGKWSKSGGDLRNFFAGGGRGATSKNLSRWSALYDNPLLSMEEIDVSNQDKRVTHLRRIAVINLKKIAGGNTAQMREIRHYAEKYWDLLEEQFKLYRPNLTIAGGVFDILVALRSAKVVPQEELRFPYFCDQDLGICIDFYHPQPRFRQNNQILFDYLKLQFNYHQPSPSEINE